MKVMYKLFYIIETVIVILWTLFFYSFYNFLSDALEFGKDETSFVIKFVMILSYRERETILFIVLAMLLMTVNCFFVHLVYFKQHNGIHTDSKLKFLLKVSFIQLIISLLLLNMNVFGIIMLPISIFSIVIVYLIYLIFKNKYGELLILRESVIGIHGPFESDDHEKKYEKFLSEIYELSQLEKILFMKDEQYYVEFKEIETDR